MNPRGRLVHIFLEETAHKAVKVHAAETGLTMQEIIANAIYAALRISPPARPAEDKKALGERVREHLKGRIGGSQSARELQRKFNVNVDALEAACKDAGLDLFTSKINGRKMIGIPKEQKDA